MQSPLFVLVIVAAVPHLILGGAGIDRLIVQLPARHRIGALAYATYARATDLGNGRFLYPILGIGGPLATWAALAVALITGLGPLLARFTRLSWIRAALQVLTAAARLWLLVGQAELK